jgi:hypothetical protein
MTRNEYIIWGIAPNTTEEVLLVSEKASIKTMEQAEEVVSKLEAEHGCTACRVQVFNLRNGFEWGENLFSK